MNCGVEASLWTCAFAEYLRNTLVIQQGILSNSSIKGEISGLFQTETFQD